MATVLEQAIAFADHLGIDPERVSTSMPIQIQFDIDGDAVQVTYEEIVTDENGKRQLHPDVHLRLWTLPKRLTTRDFWPVS